jgi:hypothetical protein
MLAERRQGLAKARPTFQPALGGRAITDPW